MKPMFIVLSLFCILFSSCKKDKNNPEPDNPYGLPNATQTGANIFACRVNGQNWISEKGIYSIGGGIYNDTLFAFGSLDVPYIETFSLRVGEHPVEGGVYAIAINSSTIFDLLSNKNCSCPNGGCTVNTIYATAGQVNITKIDTQREIVSGKFHAKVPITGCDTLFITDGRFDIRY